MIQDFEDKVAVVTGGAGGIGLAIAERALAAGMRVVIADVRVDELASAVDELDAGGRLLAVDADVSTFQGNERIADATIAKFGQVNLVCLNAGIGRMRSLSDTSVEEWRLQLAVNLDGPFYGVKAFLPLLEQEREAQLCFTGSVASLFSSPAIVPYCVTKAGLLSLAEGLSLELAAAGSQVGVSVLLPGDTNTGIVENSASEDADPEALESFTRELANGSPPGVVADALLAACKEPRFYVLPNPGHYWDIIDARMERIRNGEGPQAGTLR